MWPKIHHPTTSKTKRTVSYEHESTIPSFSKHWVLWFQHIIFLIQQPKQKIDHNIILNILLYMFRHFFSVITCNSFETTRHIPYLTASLFYTFGRKTGQRSRFSRNLKHTHWQKIGLPACPKFSKNQSLAISLTLTSY